MPVPVSTSPWGNGPGGARGFTAFDYGKAYGSNPYQEYLNKIKGLTSSILDPIKQYFGSGGTGGAESIFGTHIASPDDPEVQNYMEHILGGQRNTLDDYVKRAAAAGVNRRGLNVRGGPAQESALHAGAMRDLAGGYEDRFQRAMDYNKYRTGELNSSASEAFNNALRLLGIEQSAIGDSAGWQSGMGDRMRGDYQSDIGYMRDAPARRQAEMDAARQRYYQQKQQARADSDYLNRRKLWGLMYSGTKAGPQTLESPALMAGNKLATITNPMYGYGTPRPGEGALAQSVVRGVTSGRAGSNPYQQRSSAAGSSGRSGFGSLGNPYSTVPRGMIYGRRR